MSSDTFAYCCLSDELTSVVGMVEHTGCNLHTNGNKLVFGEMMDPAVDEIFLEWKMDDQKGRVVFGCCESFEFILFA